MFFPLYGWTMLALESTSVVNLRLAKIARGGSQAVDEIGLMLSEKVEAMIEAGTALTMGSEPSDIVDRFREHVAANEVRLSAS
jgi:hypothetical protein